MLNEGIKGFLDIIFPPRCPICDKIIKRHEKICTKCKNELKYIKEPRCYRCGKSLAEEEVEFCQDCRDGSFHYRRGFALWEYAGAARSSIAAFKYRGRQEYADFYGEELWKSYGRQLKALDFQTIIPVPIHPKRRRQRGYNQAELLARQLSERLEVPLRTDELLRVRTTKPQMALGVRERQTNLKEAFRFYPSHREQRKLGRVLLVDDIYTTGSTIEACTRVLLAAGASEVYFVVLCIGRDNRR